MTDRTISGPTRPSLPVDPAVLIVAIGCGLLLAAGGTILPTFLTAGYILQQLQIASFLGIIAAGATLVILLGHIDLSVPAAITAIAIVTTTVAGSQDPTLAALAIPIGLLTGALIGLINGIGVAFLRLPSMVWTLAMNSMLIGTVVFFTGGFKPRGMAPPLSITLSLERSFGIPNAFLFWLVVMAAMFYLLHRTVYGKYLIAMGNSEKAAYLSGIRVRLVTTLTFVVAGVFTAIGAILLAGYANQAYQGMGDPYMLPVITAVVIGGTSIMGGQGGYGGTIVGAIFITLLSSILSVLQMPEAFRQIVFGVIILAMLLIRGYKRSFR
ncbi:MULTISPECIES: ABC transporter permease [unclassified Agrobacterium]|uniref:ABC transporter permease n=1 Tax=unclassified Agrobacterium TaxID=2632611 RepID=UPI00083CDEB3|nr:MULTISPECIES: ABC transporter permease [unclassified Agrobacterium]AOG11648.1 branched-chain amino acid transport system / permease component family protein [Agrobacterium sp. RAC06]QGG92635.1 ABC transporter permease [Agrobacterium sp. MA01]